MRLLIIDDEAPARDEMVRLLKQVAPDTETVQAGDLPEARSALAQQRFDGVFLDLHLPESSGLDFFSDARLAGVPVVVATAHEEHAIECIDQGVVGYLLKPVDPEKLYRALLRLQPDRVRPGDADTLILLSDQNHYWPLRPEQIVMLTADDGYTHVLVSDGRKLTLSRTLKELEQALAGHRFIRANRGEIINLSHAKVIHRKHDGDIIANMTSDGTVHFSRRQAKALRAGKLL